MLTCLWAVTAAMAQSRSIESVRLDVSDGLSHNTVYSICQDQQGFLWFATQNGLNRYDGYRIKTYDHNPDNPNSPSHGNVAAIAADRQGYLWLGTWGGGLNRLDPVSGEFTHFRHDPTNPASIADDTIHSLYMGRDDILWIGGMNHGLTAFNTKTYQSQRFSHNPDKPTSLANNHVWSIHESPNGEIWVGTSSGLSILSQDRSRFNRFVPNEKGPINFSEESIRCLVPGREARLWIGTSRGLARLNFRSGAIRYFNDIEAIGQDFINTVFEDAAGNPYLGGIFGGLRYLDRKTGRLDHHLHDPGNPATIGHNDVRCLYEDRSGNLWIGTRGGGISKINLKPPKFTTWRNNPNRPNGLAYGEVHTLLAADDTIWVGLLNGGLNRLDRGTGRIEVFRSNENNPGSLSDNRVRCLEMTPKRTLWVGTLEGLNLLDIQSKQFTQYTTSNTSGMANQRINDLLLDQDRLLIATDGGLVVHENSTFRSIVHNPNTADGIPAGRIHVLFKDSNDTRWLGTHSGGLARFDNSMTSFKTYSHQPGNPQSLSNNYVISINEAQGDLWVGTWGGGLNRLDRDSGEFKTYLPADGLSDTIICGILVDGRDRLWIATTKGVNRFDPHDNAFRNYGAKDGLQGEQFSAGGVFQAPSGEMFMGGSAGFSAFFPEQVQDDYFVPEVVISRFEADGSLMAARAGDTLILDRGRRNFTAEFAALDFTDPRRNRYSYKLEGMETQWSRPDVASVARYTNLSPGAYRFHVKAANHDGVWNDEGVTVDFQVVAAWHETWWAMTGGVLLLIFGVTMLIRFYSYRERTRAKMEMLRASEMMAVAANRGKSAFLAHMGHELRTPLNAIIGYSELVAEDLEEPDELDPEQCRADLAKIKSSAHYQLGQVNNLLEFTKIDTGESAIFCETFEIKQVVDVVKAHIQPMLEKTENRLRIILEPEAIGVMHADIIKVRAVLMNLLDNANKFTKSGRIDLRITRLIRDTGDLLEFKVQDTGVGMTTEKMAVIFQGLENVTIMNTVYKGPGLGLYICQHFCKMMGGTIEVESEPAQGSTFTAVIPAKVETAAKKAD